jgi:hypothetical protein
MEPSSKRQAALQHVGDCFHQENALFVAAGLTEANLPLTLAWSSKSNQYTLPEYKGLSGRTLMPLVTGSDPKGRFNLQLMRAQGFSSKYDDVQAFLVRAHTHHPSSRGSLFLANEPTHRWCMQVGECDKAIATLEANRSKFPPVTDNMVVFQVGRQAHACMGGGGVTSQCAAACQCAKPTRICRPQEKKNQKTHSAGTLQRGGGGSRGRGSPSTAVCGGKGATAAAAAAAAAGAVAAGHGRLPQGKTSGGGGRPAAVNEVHRVSTATVLLYGVPHLLLLLLPLC